MSKWEASLIEKAKLKYPVSIPFKGRLTEEEIEEIERECDIQCVSVYMNGDGYYLIRKKVGR